MMYVLGLTGGLGSGKSTVAAIFAEKGATVVSADAIVAGLTCPGGSAFEEIRALFTSQTDMLAGALDREMVFAALQNDPQILEKMEEILHPRVRSAVEADILRARQQEDIALLVLEVPLLYQAKFDTLCDGVLACLCDRKTRLQRALKRPGMSPEKFDFLCARQLEDDLFAEKADFVIHTGGTKEETRAQTLALLRQLLPDAES